MEVENNTELLDGKPHGEIPYELSVQIEHEDLLHALHDSLDRSSTLQRQVLAKQSKEDAKSILHLRNEALKAKADELISTKQVQAANELIQSLNYEISALKRQIRDIQNDKLKPSSAPNNQKDTFPLYPSKVGDDFGKLFAGNAAEDTAAVDNLYGQSLDVQSFEKWKLRKWINPSDKIKENPAIENQITQMLAEAATRESLTQLSLDSEIVDKIRTGKLHMNAYFDQKNQPKLSRSVDAKSSTKADITSKPYATSNKNDESDMRPIPATQRKVSTTSSVGGHSQSSVQGSVMV